VSTRRRRIGALRAGYRPSGLSGLVDDREKQARSTLAYAVVPPVFLAVVAVLDVALGEPVLGGVVLAAAGVATAGLVLFKRTGAQRRSATLQLWSVLPAAVATHVMLGGWLWSGGALLWGSVATITAVLVLGRREAALMAGAYLAVAVVLTPWESSLRSWRDQPPLALSVMVVAGVLVLGVTLVAPGVAVLAARLEREHRRSQALLSNVLPASIIQRLSQGPAVVATRHDDCTILFADLVGFTAHTHQMDPEAVVAELNTIMSVFDDLVGAHGAEKIKTIGDGYMAAVGVPEPRDDHAISGCALALDMLHAMPRVNRQLGTDYRIRIGMNRGEVVAGVIGTRRFAFDLWGDTVNLASRLESSGSPGTVTTSAAVKTAASEHFRFAGPDVKDLKGQGPTAVYRLVGPRTRRVPAGR